MEKKIIIEMDKKEYDVVNRLISDIVKLQGGRKIDTMENMEFKNLFLYINELMTGSYILGTKADK